MANNELLTKKVDIYDGSVASIPKKICSIWIFLCIKEKIYWGQTNLLLAKQKYCVVIVFFCGAKSYWCYLILRMCEYCRCVRAKKKCGAFNICTSPYNYNNHNSNKWKSAHYKSAICSKAKQKSDAITEWNEQQHSKKNQNQSEKKRMRKSATKPIYTKQTCSRSAVK